MIKLHKQNSRVNLLRKGGQNSSSMFIGMRLFNECVGCIRNFYRHQCPRAISAGSSLLSSSRGCHGKLHHKECISNHLTVMPSSVNFKANIHFSANDLLLLMRRVELRTGLFPSGFEAIHFKEYITPEKLTNKQFIDFKWIFSWFLIWHHLCIAFPTGNAMPWITSVGPICYKLNTPLIVLIAILLQ